MKTVIMAGGKGTRIAELFPDIPKPLIPIKGIDGTKKPVLEWEICSLVSQGFTEIILTVGYKAAQIQEHFGTGERLGCQIEYFVEDTPLGNAGALIKYRDRLGDEPFLLLIADAMFDVDFNRFTQFHKERGGLATLFTHPNSHPYDSSVIIAATDGEVEQWLTKEDVVLSADFIIAAFAIDDVLSSRDLQFDRIMSAPVSVNESCVSFRPVLADPGSESGRIDVA